MIAVFAFCVFIQLFFMFRHALLKSKSGNLKREVQELSIQKDKALVAMQIAQSNAGDSAAPLAELFVKVPVWSTALSDLAKAMPKQLWLETIRSTTAGDAGDIKKLEISGRGVSHAAVASFVSSLDASERFQNTIMVNSQKGASGYTFLVNTEVLFPQAEW
ncbi:MAG: PilN domain-containing protein [Deltaproteobacteria bacterium]|nr:PilN domain-containing protein [Deltaproteobacteria bacterium]